MSGSYQLQLAVHNALNSDSALSALITGIYDNPEQVANPEDDGAYPYLTISQGTIEPWDDDADKGSQADIDIHTWSRARHSLEAKQIMDAIYNVLHRGTLSITGYFFVGCDMLNQENPRYDPDGITRHGVQTFRVVFQEV